MSYHVYTTQGIVLEGSPLGEADKYYSIFTKELGLIFATAKSVRRPESKLRFALDDFSVSELAFIRGKHSWKITGGRNSTNIYRDFTGDIRKRDSAIRILLLLKQLVAGEEKNEALFILVADALDFLKKVILTKEALLVFECIAILRILSSLGYVKNSEAHSSFIDTSVWSEFLLHDAVLHTLAMQKEIRSSIEASQL